MAVRRKNPIQTMGVVGQVIIFDPRFPTVTPQADRSDRNRYERPPGVVTGAAAGCPRSPEASPRGGTRANSYGNPASSVPIFRVRADAGLSVLGWRAVWSGGDSRYRDREVAYAWPASSGLPLRRPQDAALPSRGEPAGSAGRALSREGMGGEGWGPPSWLLRARPRPTGRSDSYP